MPRQTLTKGELEELRKIESGGTGSRTSTSRGYRDRSKLRDRVPLNSLHREIIDAYRRSRPTWSETTVYFVALRQLHRIRRLAAAAPPV
jgi:hypothetical protein